MAKGNNPSTLSPFRFIAGAAITEDDYVDALEESAHAAGNTPEVLASGGAGPVGWSLYQCTYPTTLATWETVWRGTFKVADDHQTILLGVLSEFAALESGQARILVGGVQRASVMPSSANNDAWLTDSFTVAAIGGAGEYDFEVQLQTVVGVATDNHVRAWLLQTEDVPSAATWPDPSG